MKPRYSVYQFFFLCFTALATLLLLSVGGLVTSHNVGMSVPDWPTTYGYNMFLFPWSKMVGGILIEHSHRLIASGVGLLTLIMAIQVTFREERSWMKKLAWLAVILVIFQGILGGLRVVWMKDEIGIFHACLAQSFFVLIGLLALFSSKTWLNLEIKVHSNRTLRKRSLLFVIITLSLIFLQLTLGASMRHEHNDLAITDFPLAYGKLIPSLDPSSLNEMNEQRLQKLSLQPTTRYEILLQLFHRGVALFILLGMVLTWMHFLFNQISYFKKWANLWLLMILTQIGLGAWTIWSNKAADVATLHMLLGSLILLVGALFLALLGRYQKLIQPLVKK